MADIIDFKSALEQANSQEQLHAGDCVELQYDAKPGSVAVRLTSTGDAVAHFSVTAPAADIDAVAGAAHDSLMASFGFAPDDARAEAAVREHMGESYDAFVTTFVQQHFFELALLRTGVSAFLDPDYLTTVAPVAGQDYTFEIEALLRPEFQLSSYDPVSVEVPEKQEVSSKDVTAYLSHMADELATWEEDTSRDAVIEGDHVSLNLDSTAGGHEFKQLTGRHMSYVVGLGTVSPEFDAALVGMAPRERKELSLSVPVATTDGEASFQVVQVKVQIDQILRKVPARIDDAWVVQNMPEAQTLLGLRGRIRTVLERDAERAYREQLMSLTAEKLTERLVGELDPRYVEKMRAELVGQYIAALQQQGVDYQQFMSQPGFDMAAWEQEMTEQAADSLRRGLALDALANHLDIQLEERDIAQVVGQMAPGHEQETLASLVESGQMAKICEVAQRIRANEWLVDNLPAAGKPAAGKPASGPTLILGGGAKADRPKGDGPKLTLL